MSEAIPTTMQAVEIKEAGPPETLVLTTRPVPTPARPGRGKCSSRWPRPG